MSGSLAMNVFRQDAFSGLTLTDQVNRVPYMPGLLGQLGIFEDFPIYTTALEVDRKDSFLRLIPTSPRGAPKTERTVEKRQARYFNCPRLAEEDVIYASMIQNVRSETDEMALKDLSEEVAIRLSGPSGLTSQVEYTWENHRLGAVQGVLVDSDGATVINNWYTEFGITQPTEVGFDFANAGNNASGYVVTRLNGVVRAMKRAGGGAFIEGRTVVHALCGDAWFDAFINHPDVKQFYLNWSAAQNLRDSATRVFGDFEFGGVIFHNYRGSDDNSTIAVPTHKVKFFPVNAPGVFKVAWAPGETFGAVNKKGRPMYVNRKFDTQEDPEWVKFSITSYPLHICVRPEMLQSGRDTA